MMERRELFAILGGAATSVAANQVNIAAYTPRFFSAEEYAMLDELTALLIPSDGSPGAREAGVRYYIDTVLHYADAGIRETWKDGLRAIDKECRSRFGRTLSACDADQRSKLMDSLAARGSSPGQKFFRPFKLLTVEAFAMSESGRQFFEYRGNTAIAEFPGCEEKEG